MVRQAKDRGGVLGGTTTSPTDTQSRERELWDQRNPAQPLANPEIMGQLLKSLTVRWCGGMERWGVTRLTSLSGDERQLR